MKRAYFKSGVIAHKFYQRVYGLAVDTNQYALRGVSLGLYKNGFVVKWPEQNHIL